MRSAQHDAPAAAAISARGISKRFGRRDALRDIDLDAARGELVGVIGPNGAGKTTLLSILAGILKPDAGTVAAADDRVGWVPQRVSLYRRLTVSENLRLFTHLEGIDAVDETVDRMLEQSGLTERRHDQISSLSGGNQQRINIAVGLLADPQVLLLDEPSTGLDPRQRARLWEFVERLVAGGTTVIFSTHHIQEAERHASRLLVLADGEGLFDGTAAELHAAASEAHGAGDGDFEASFVAFLRGRGH